MNGCNKKLFHNRMIYYLTIENKSMRLPIIKFV